VAGAGRADIEECAVGGDYCGLAGDVRLGNLCKRADPLRSTPYTRPFVAPGPGCRFIPTFVTVGRFRPLMPFCP
jgi:hypothetical protein